MSSSDTPGPPPAAAGAAPDRPFNCAYCTKSFGRLEHQRRHELIHTSAKPYSCSTCSKEFIRKDALQRHELTHQSNAPTLLQLGARACANCATARVRCSGEVQCQRCQQRSLDCTYPENASPRPMQPPTPSASHPPDIMQSNMEQIGMMNDSDPMHMQQLDQTDFWDPGMLAETNWLEFDMTGFDPSIPYYGMSMSFPPGFTGLTNPATPAHMASVQSVPSPALTGSSHTGADSTDQPVETGEFYVDGEPARLPRIKRRKTSTTTPQFHDTNFGFSLAEPMLLSPPQGTNIIIGNADYEILKEAYSRCCLTQSAMYQSFEQAPFPRKEFLEHLIHLYIEHFSAILPFLHKTYFNEFNLHWTLVAALASVGCHYAESDRKHAFSVSMHEFMRRIIALLQQADELTATVSEYNETHALLLHAMSSAYCGNSNLSAQGLACQQRLSVLYVNIVQQQRDWASPSAIPGGAGEVTWHQWLGNESTNRLAYAIWLVDCMFTYHFNRRALLTLDDASLPLPCNDKLWSAQDSTSFHAALTDQPLLRAPPSSLAKAMKELYIDKRLPREHGEFARTLMIHGLFQRSWEVERYFANPLSQWEPLAQRQNSADVLPSEEVWLPSIPTFAKWQNSACDALDILHWQANATIGQASGLEHPTILHLHMARIVLLVPYNNIISLAKSLTSPSPSPSTTKPDSPDAIAVRRWVLSHQYKARLAAVHAGVILWHVRRYSVDGFYEAPAVALAGLTLWAFGMFGGVQPASVAAGGGGGGGGARKVGSGQVGSAATAVTSPRSEADADALPSIILLDRPTDDELVQHFIRHGEAGKMEAHISGVGNVYAEGGPEGVLKLGGRLLGSGARCWGVASGWMELLGALGRGGGGRGR